MKQFKHKTSLLLASSFIVLAALVGNAFLPSNQAYAVSGSEFQAGRVMDDGIFFGPNTMTSAEIQTFLNAKVPSCDTNGTQPYAGTTAAAYGTSRGYPPPYICLKNFRQDTVSKSAETGLCNGYPTANHSAADIIYNVAQSCGINPRVLLVLLQKEQGLVTDSWPWSSQYRSATGYGCPDTAPCDSQYYGFFNQVYMAARQFKRYALYPNDYNHIPGRNNSVLFHPNAGTCGSSSVYIQNKATSALYNYTPYQPNQPALNNLYGTGDGCSSYGNRNFWRYFNDWFGSTTRFNGSIILSKGLQLTPATSYANDTITATYEVENTASSDIYVGGLGVCARMNGYNYDFGFIHHKTIPANSKATISFTRQMDWHGTLDAFICSYHENLGGWASDRYPYNSSTIYPRQASLNILPNPLVTTGVSLSPANPAAGQPVTASATVTNNSNAPVNIGSLVVAGRSPSGQNMDFGIVNDVVVPAKGTYTYSQSRTLPSPGSYTFFFANWNKVWRTDYPQSANGSIVRQLTASVLDNPLITVGISLSPANPVAGQSVTATMTIRNAASTSVNIGSMVIAGRSPSGQNMDFGIVNDVTIPAGGTYVYSQNRTFPSAGSYNLFIANWNGVWSKDYPKSADGSVLRQMTLQVAP